MDKQKLATGGFILTLGVVAWGFTDGWILGQKPEPPRKPAPSGKAGLVVRDKAPKDPRPRVRTLPGKTGKREAPAATPQDQPSGPWLSMGGPRRSVVEGEGTSWRPEEPMDTETPQRGRFGRGELAPLRYGEEPTSARLTYGSLRRDDPRGSGKSGREERWMRYTGKFKGHWLDDIDRGGRTVELEDGSLWEVADSQQYRAMGWQPVTNVTIRQTSKPPYPYVIFGAGRSVDVRLLRGPSSSVRIPDDAEDMPMDN